MVAVGGDCPAHPRILMTKHVHTRCCRLLERLSRRSRPNYLRARSSLQRPNIISSGQLLRYMQVGLATLPSDEIRHMLTEDVCHSLIPFVFIGGVDTVRLSHVASRVHDH